MHRCSAPIPLLSVAIAVLVLLPGVVAGQEATPAGGNSAPIPLLRLTLDELSPEAVSAVGVTRTTYAPGGRLTMVAGGGPVVLLVESGALVAGGGADSRPLLVVEAETAAGAGTPAAVAAGDERRLEAGDALVLPAGEAVEIRNDGADPAASLDLLAVAEARLEAETGITQAVLTRLQANLPAPPVTVALDRTTIPPGDRLSLPPPPAQAVVAAVDRAQTFLLTGANFNRGTTPMPVYVLTIAPASPASPMGGTPPP